MKFSQKLILLPFLLCVGFLQILGKCFRLSYKQISVVFNLYLQGAILTFSGIMPLVAIIWNIHKCSIEVVSLLLGCAIYFSIYVTAFISMLRHYHLPLEYAFDLCVKDLQWIASKWHISYYAVNIVIFILWWLSIIGMNVLVSYSLCNM